ncbi:MAG: diaminopimelate epimerase [Eubacteriales bacterium]|nr:diaminopimelate epimerase [Eubacteriales bacterium]
MDFTKMHGLGNDFLVFEDDGAQRDWQALAKKACQRRLSVGGDGILIVLPSSRADIRMRIINADGSEAEMCGNGIRCFAKYVYETGIVDKIDMTVETLAGIIRPRLTLEDGKVSDVSVDMGKPSYDRASIPMTGEGDPFDVEIKTAGRIVTISSMLMGVPHTMVLTDDLDAIEAAVLGPAIERHDMFPRKTNVNFVKIIDESNIEILTWERGAGLTLACGTGSCASAVAMHKKGLVGAKVTVHHSVGRLVIESLEDGRVIMTGPAERVYRATLEE